VERLAGWGLRSAAPIATNIMAPSMADIVRLVETHPCIDFYLRRDILDQLSPEVRSTRRIVALSSDRSFLLATDRTEARVLQGGWNVPDEW
jgi:hypothetical protein